MSEQLTELVVHEPDFSSDHFYVEKSGPGYQRWMRQIIAGDELECFLEDKQRWQKGAITSWFVDDGSGNAPDIDSHYILWWNDEQGQRWRYNLHNGLRVKLLAPTDEDLRARPKFCEGYDWGLHPSDDTKCSRQDVTHYVSPGGVDCWYCDEHKPDWPQSRASTNWQVGSHVRLVGTSIVGEIIAIHVNYEESGNTAYAVRLPQDAIEADCMPTDVYSESMLEAPGPVLDDKRSRKFQVGDTVLIRTGFYAGVTTKVTGCFVDEVHGGIPYVSVDLCEVPFYEDALTLVGRETSTERK